MGRGAIGHGFLAKMTPTGGRKPHTLGRGKADLKTLKIVIANAMHFTKNVVMVKITKAVRINAAGSFSGYHTRFATAEEMAGVGSACR
jgi:hypothetical protein